ncbi:hypothetical protein ABIC83_002842 [Roseateles asaccharophilus]|uniref:hypothetical protein n=1 Tax=Roseateles asaccharophilus TaxID=582607 RepID=UPI003835872F
MQSNQAAAPQWEKLTPNAMAKLVAKGYTEGGFYWICVKPGLGDKEPRVTQADYVGVSAVAKGSPHEEAFECVNHQLIPASRVTHVMPFSAPKPPSE